MAARNLTHEIKVTKHRWCDCYCGTKAALVAAGIGDPGKFPGDPGNKKVMQTYYEGGLRTRFTRVSKTRYEVLIECSEEEKAKRVAAEDVEHKRKEAQKDIDALPKSKAEYVAWVKRLCIPALDAFLFAARKGWAGYRCSADSVSEIEGALHEVVEALHAAEITFDSRAHHKLENAMRSEVARAAAEAARADPDFASFLRCMTEKPLDPTLATD